MEPFMTFEDIKPIFDRLSHPDKLEIVNYIRQDFGFNPLPHPELLAIGGFTRAEMEIVGMAIAAENN
jgi:hypothetical protein